MRKPLSLYHPWLYWLRVWQRRLWRHCRWRLGGRRYVRLPSVDERLPYRYIKHTSKLIRRLGDSDLALQRNKLVNLRLAVDCMNGVSIGPGSTSRSAGWSVGPAPGVASSKVWSCPSARRAAESAAASAN